MGQSIFGGFMLAALVGGSALSGCTPAVTSASPQSARANPITSGPQIGRCYGEGCIWYDIRFFEVVRETGDGALIRLNMREGSSDSVPGRPHPVSSRGVNIEWGEFRSDQYVFCSRQLPAMIHSSDGGEAHVTVLDLLQWGVPTEVITNIYGHVCHPGEDILREGAAARAGYRSMEGREREFSLGSPEAIFERIGR